MVESPLGLLMSVLVHSYLSQVVAWSGQTQNRYIRIETSVVTILKI